MKMRIAWFRVAALSVFLTLAVAGVAWAHVTVNPEEVPPDSFEVLTVRVPNERDVPTTKVRVEAPEAFTVAAVRPIPGWEHQFEKQGEVVRAITWSGGELGPEEFQQFDLLAATPEQEGRFAWRAFQTYQDGEVVEWIGPPDSDQPASVVEVISSGSSSHGAGSGAATSGEQGGTRSEDQEEAGGAPLPGTGGMDPHFVFSGFVGALLLAATGLMLLRRIRA